jgi:hypothetical protein
MTQVPSFEDKFVLNEKYTIQKAREVMQAYILGEGNKNSYINFISTDHSKKRGLMGYNDKEFDKINSQAFESILLLELYTLFEKEVDQELTEDLSGANESLTLQDVKDGNALNFYSVLDLNNKNVQQALGLFGYQQYTQTGKTYKSIKEFFDNPREPNTKKIAFDSEQARIGFRDGVLQELYRKVKGVETGEYPDEFFDVRYKFVLTPLENERWGDKMAKWLVDSNLEGGMTNKEIALPKTREVNVEQMDLVQFFNFLDTVLELEPVKWKTYLKGLGERYIPYKREQFLEDINKKNSESPLKGVDLEQLLNLSSEYVQDLKEEIDKVNPKKIVKPSGDEMVDIKQEVDMNTLRTTVGNFIAESNLEFFNRRSGFNTVFGVTVPSKRWRIADNFFDAKFVGPKGGRPSYNLIEDKETYTNKSDLSEMNESPVTVLDRVSRLHSALSYDPLMPREVRVYLNLVETFIQTKDEMLNLYDILDDDNALLVGRIEEFIKIHGDKSEELLAEEFVNNEEEAKELNKEFMGNLTAISEGFSLYLNQLETPEDDGDDSESGPTNPKDLTQEQIDTLYQYEGDAGNKGLISEIKSAYKDINRMKVPSRENINDAIENLFKSKSEYEEDEIEMVEEFEKAYEEIVDGDELEEINYDNVAFRIEQIFNISDKTLGLDNSEIQQEIEGFMAQKGKTNLKEGLTDYLIGVITNDSSDSTKWGPATRWSLSGNLEFTLEFITNETSQKVVGFTEFKQQHQVKILQNEGSGGGNVYSTLQENRNKTDKKARRTYNITMEGKGIVSSGKAINEQKKTFIDKIEERLQLLDMVI